jgi:hypothetical protein
MANKEIVTALCTTIWLLGKERPFSGVALLSWKIKEWQMQ